MADKKIYIADGHHRYEVAKTYRDLRKKEEGYDGGADYVMMYFTDLECHDNLTVMATHRVVKDMPASSDAEIINRLKEYFEIEGLNTLSGLMRRLRENEGKGHVFGYFGGQEYIVLNLKDENKLRNMITEDRSMEWKKLDVSILHSVIFKKILSIEDGEGNLTYVKKAEEAEELVKDKSHKAAFFLNPTRVSQLKTVTEQGDMMPQKSTYFYPKLLTGLVINKFD